MAPNNQTEESAKADKRLNWQDTFEKFLEVFIINKKPLITDGGIDEFKNEDIEDCLTILNGVETMNPPKDKDDKSLFSRLKDLKEKNDHSYPVVFSLLWHCYWIMYLMGDTAKGFMNELKPDGLELKEKYDDNGSEINLVVDEIASTNQAYNSKAIRPFKCLLILIQKLWGKQDQKEIQRVKDDIVKFVWTARGSEPFEYKNDEKNENYDNRVKNILLYLCAPQKYIPIVSQDHKNAISSNLGFLVQSNDEEEKYRLIEEEINNQPGGSSLTHSLYNKSIRPFWDTKKVNLKTDADGELEMETLLLFKKAIVLYGPPGTSKSYTARELAKSVICKKLVEILKKQTDKKKPFNDFLKNEDVLFGGKRKNEVQKTMTHIHRLQLHPNYTYDDFIVGKTIRGNSVVIQKGYLLNLIDEIEKDRQGKDVFKDLPHIVILDEINRVDISRVFGELFTAMESSYRVDGVELPASIITKYEGGQEQKTPPLPLKVPEDLYFIGTMNMIDFSLEQVDFALRRRFAWIESTFDKDRLKEIIKEKYKNPIFDIEKYVQLCDDVNKIIGETMGEEYWIGHTFFAEIVDIINITGYDSSKNQDTKKEEYKEISKARKFLWAISIKPMIEAYCGSMNKEAKDGFVGKCNDAFFPKPKQDKNTKKEQEESKAE